MSRHAWLLWIGLWAGCTSAPPPPPPTEAPFTVEDYRSRAPVEIAVLPPSIAPNFGAADGDLLREHIYSRLIEKGYTGLDPEYVDRAVESVVERGRLTSESTPPRVSALRSLLDSEAFLLLEVINVKVLPGGEPSIYRIEVRATLVDTLGSTLFEHRVTKTFEVEYGDDRELSRDQLDDLMRRYAAQLVNALPARSSSKIGD